MNSTDGLYSLLRGANGLYYRIMTKYGGVRWIILHLGSIFKILFSLCYLLALVVLDTEM